MLQFVLQKIRSKRWLMACLLIGDLLLVAIAASNPMYTKAALQRMLSRTMDSYVQAHNHYPSTVYIHTASTAGHDKLAQDQAVVDSLGDTLGMEPLTVVSHRYLDDVKLSPELVRAQKKSISARLGALDDMESHVRIVSGSLYAQAPDQDGTAEAILSEKCLVNLGLMVGETLTVSLTDTKDAPVIQVRIAGVFRANDTDPLYWYRTPGEYDDQLFLSRQAFSAVVPQEILERKEHAIWYWIFDHNKLTVDHCMAAAQASGELHRQFSEEKHHSYEDYFSSLVESYQLEAAKVQATLQILQVPIYVLLAAFIFMVSRQMLELEAGEIAVLKSRGASRSQILKIYGLQSALLGGASLVLGIPLAMLVCQVIGSANAFLEFVSRSALRLQITWPSLLYAAAAALLGMAAMVLPVLRYSRTTIVAAKQGKARKRSVPLWQKLFLDVVLLAVSLYGLYTFRGQEEQITEKVRSGHGLDPLIYLASSLFIVACGLLALRIIPLVVKLIYRLGQRWWSPSLYASFLWVLRAKGGGYIMTFLVVTIALGIFNASAARTVNNNETDRITYSGGGADVVMMERWNDNAAQVEGDETGLLELIYQEPDYAKFAAIPGVTSTTRVYCDNRAGVTLKNAGRGSSVTLMGIHTREFGQTARLKGGLLPHHFYEYLNAISQRSNAVLVSSQFRDQFGFKLGDPVYFSNNQGRYIRGTVYGFVDYWPGYSAVRTVKAADGTMRREDNLLIVANLNYLQTQWGVAPYQVWLRMEDEDTSPVYDFVEQQGLTLTLFRDRTADLVAMKNDPGIQGTNGILTVGFVVALLLCAVGFLIYWILAIQNRALQFGVFRAMGMTMKEIVIMLFNEQLYVSGLSILIGVGAGVLGSWLFVPLIQLAYVKAEAPLPLEVSLAGGDVIRLLLVMLVVVIVCMAVLGTIIRKLKIAQALKLGED